MILQADDENTETDSVLQPPEPLDTAASTTEVLVEDLHLSLDAFEGVRHARTIRFAVELNGIFHSSYDRRRKHRQLSSTKIG